MRSLEYPCQWRDMEMIFCMRDYEMSEVFWESVEEFIDSHGGLITPLRSELLKIHAEHFAISIHENDTP